MASEDVFQKSDKSFFKFSDPGGVLAIAFQKPGNGVLTRQSEGVFRVTYPAGKGIDPDRTTFHYANRGAIQHNVSMTTNTELIKEFTFRDVVSEPTDVVTGDLTICEVLGD